MFTLDQIHLTSLFVAFRAQLKSDSTWVTFYDYKLNEKQELMFDGLDFEGNKILVSIDEIIVEPSRIAHSIQSLTSKLQVFESALDVLLTLQNRTNKESSQ